MRLCFLYKSTYAPYSKWFGTAFSRLDVDDKVKHTLSLALSANSLESGADDSGTHLIPALTASFDERLLRCDDVPVGSDHIRLHLSGVILDFGDCFITVQPVNLGLAP